MNDGGAESRRRTFLSQSVRFALAASSVMVVASTGAACSRSDGRVKGGQSTTPSPTPHPNAATALGAFFGPALRVAPFGAFGLSRAGVVSAEHPNFSRALQVEYPEGSASQRSAGTDGTPHGGTQLYLDWVHGAVDQAYLSYWLKFEKGFDFVKGGKLPGLFGGRVTSGRHIPDGADGFSTRYMWRARGRAEVYSYLPTSVAHGTSLGRGDWSWPTGTWTNIEQHVELNTPGTDDGLVEVWLNGQKVLKMPGLDFRSTTALKIQGLFFSTFFGGGDSSWSTPRTQWSQFADFQISTERIGV